LLNIMSQPYRTPRVRGALLFPVVLLIVLSACTTQNGEGPIAPRTASPSASGRKAVRRVNAPKLAKAVHERINRARRKEGVSTFRWDAALGRIAGKHSRDMAKRGYFSHTSPEGRGPAQRYLKEHYACGVTIDGTLRYGAEVIFRISAGNAGIDAADRKAVPQGIAGAVVDGWLASDTDRKVILSPHWQREGVGTFVSPDGTVFVTVNFC